MKSASPTILLQVQRWISRLCPETAYGDTQGLLLIMHFQEVMIDEREHVSRKTRASNENNQ